MKIIESNIKKEHGTPPSLSFSLNISVIKCHFQMFAIAYTVNPLLDPWESSLFHYFNLSILQ